MRKKPPSEATLGRGNPRVNRSFNCGLPYKSGLQPQFQVRRPSGAPPDIRCALAPAPFIFLLCQSQHPRQSDVVEVSNGLEELQRWILLAVLDLIHVGVIAAHLLCNVLV